MTTQQREFARDLRKRQTSAEELVWRALRGRRLGGWKFRRQVPVAGYVVDFLCFDAKLAVEIDGHQHDQAPGYDARRTAELEAQGFTIVRFTNTDVRERLDAVLFRIEAALRRV